MIHDTLDQFVRYTGLHARFEIVAKWLKETDLGNLQLGRHEILPNGEAFANVQEIDFRGKTAIPAEYHRKYIDIQIPVTGVEQMGWQPRAAIPSLVTFDETQDVALVHLPTEDWVTVKPGEFVVFFPTDVHTPGYVTTAPHKKIIIKVLY